MERVMSKSDVVVKSQKKTETPPAKELESKQLTEEEAEAKRIAEEKKHQEEAECIAEESTKQASAVTKFDPQSMLPYIDEFGYLRKLDASELAELKSVLLTAPKNYYQSQFLLGQLYIQENTSASNLRLAYDAIKTASEHGIYEAGAFMAYFYLYGKVIPQDLDEAERRIKLDDDFKKNPIFVQMMIDLYTQKGNAMLADVWKSKLKKLK
jgi:TPR repeat protein